MTAPAYYAAEKAMHAELAEARCTPEEVMRIWKELCQRFEISPRLEFTRGRRYSKGCPQFVRLNQDRLTWLTVAHEFGHALIGRRDGNRKRWHGKLHRRAVMRVVRYIKKKGWNK